MKPTKTAVPPLPTFLPYPQSLTGSTLNPPGLHLSYSPHPQYQSQINQVSKSVIASTSGLYPFSYFSGVPPNISSALTIGLHIDTVLTALDS